MAGAVAAVVVLWPWLAPGDLVVRDLVAVVDPGFSTVLLSPAALPREVPGEVLVALVGQVVSGGLVVRLALLAALVALGAGAGRLAGAPAPGAVAGHVGPAVAGFVAVWNPYVLARLHQGQWLVVVGLAAVPWVVVHLVDRDNARLLRTCVVAALTGFLAWVVVVPTLLVGGLVLRRWRAVGVALAAVVVLSLPWLVIAGGVVADPDGFAAFAPNADLAAGVLPSLVAGGGHFNAAVASPWRDGWVVTVLALSLVAAAGCGVRRWGGAPQARTALGIAAGLALAVTAVAATAVGRDGLVALAEVVPATAVVRDAQRLLAPWVVLLAVGAGVAAADLAARAATPAGVTMLCVLLAVVALPDPVIGPRLPAPVSLPAGWHQAADAIDADAPQRVLVVPHGRTQRYDFTGGRPVHVPLQRLVGSPVVTDGRLEVEDVDGSVLVVDEQTGGDQFRELAEDWPAVTGSALAAAGVGWVAITDPAQMVVVAPPGLSAAVSTPTLQLLRNDIAVPVVVTPPWILALDMVLLLAAGALVVAPGVWARRARNRETSPDAAFTR